MASSPKPSIPAEAFWDDVPLMLVAVAADGGVVGWNQQADQRLEISDGKLGWAVWENLVPSETERIRLKAFLESGGPGEVDLQTGGGWIRIRIQPSKNWPRLAAIEEITDSTRQMDELRERCVTLEKRLTLSRQDRQLIAFEIHDGVVQEMTAAQMFLEAGLAQLKRDEAEANEHAVKCFQDGAFWLRRSIEGSRQLIHGLQPPEMENVGLAEAVRIMASNSPLADNITIEANGDFADIDESLVLCVYRIVQESLTNAWKHAEADRAVVRMRMEAGQIQLEIEDNGEGFDTTATSDDRFGLKGMRQRIVVFGGQLDVESQVGKGTTIRATLPVEV